MGWKDSNNLPTYNGRNRVQKYQSGGRVGARPGGRPVGVQNRIPRPRVNPAINVGPQNQAPQGGQMGSGSTQTGAQAQSTNMGIGGDWFDAQWNPIDSPVDPFDWGGNFDWSNWEQFMDLANSGNLSIVGSGNFGPEGFWGYLRNPHQIASPLSYANGGKVNRFGNVDKNALRGIIRKRLSNILNGK